MVVLKIQRKGILVIWRIQERGILVIWKIQGPGIFAKFGKILKGGVFLVKIRIHT